MHEYLLEKKSWNLIGSTLDRIHESSKILYQVATVARLFS